MPFPVLPSALQSASSSAFRRLVAAILLGCAAGHAGAYPVTVRSCDRDVTFDRAPTRAVSNDVNLTEMMLVLGLKDRLVGYTGIGGWKTGTARVRDALRGVPELASQYPSLEVLAAARADFYLAGWNYGMHVGGAVTPATLAPFGIRTYELTESCSHVMKQTAASFDDVFRDLNNLGRIFGVDARAAQVVAAMRERLAAVSRAIGRPAPLRVFVYDSGTDKPMTAGALAMPTALLTAAGARNVMADLPRSWTQVSWESVVARDPQVIVIVDYSAVTAAQKQQFLLSQPSLARVAAIRDRRFIVIPYDAATPGPENVAAVETLARAVSGRVRRAGAMSGHVRASRLGMRTVLPALALLLVVSIVVSAAFGPAPIAMPAAVRIVATHIVAAFGEAGAIAAGAGDDSIVWLIRMPRALLAAIVGATLAAVGVALQAATANRLADPHLLGVSAGAMLGAVAVTVLAGAALGPFTLSAAAFAGALAATACVIALAYRRGRLESDRLLLAGVSVSFMMAAFGNLLLYLGDQRAASSVLFWMLGGVGLARWDLLPVPAACAVLAGGALYARRRELNALMSGDVAAAALGVPSARMRREVFVVASFATGAMVAVSGVIGFVGLVTPHLCRRVVGAEHGRLLPVAALTGAILLVWADVAARTLAAPEDLPIGIVTAMFGSLFFVALLRRR